VSDALDRGMGAVRHREGVVDVDVADAASCATKPGSLRSSPGWNRVFSRHKMSPGFMALTAAAARSPMQSSANATGACRPGMAIISSLLS